MKEQKFGAAASSDQGSFNESELVDSESPKYRGFRGVSDFGAGDGMIVDDDDVPVYRSLGLGDDTEPGLPAPTLCRQKGKSNLFGAVAPPP